MKKNKLKRGITILLISFTLIVISTTVLAENLDFLNPNEIRAHSSSGVRPIRDISGQLLAIIQVVGVAVAVIMLVWIGIKYIAAAPSEKADIKKSAVVYIVGAILLFGATGVIQIFKGVGDSIANARPI